MQSQRGPDPQVKKHFSRPSLCLKGYHTPTCSLSSTSLLSDHSAGPRNSMFKGQSLHAVHYASKSTSPLEPECYIIMEVLNRLTVAELVRRLNEPSRHPLPSLSFIRRPSACKGPDFLRNINKTNCHLTWFTIDKLARINRHWLPWAFVTSLQGRGRAV